MTVSIPPILESHMIKDLKTLEEDKEFADFISE
jgi:hypothetical protein